MSQISYGLRFASSVFLCDIFTFPLFSFSVKEGKLATF